MSTGPSSLGGSFIPPLTLSINVNLALPTPQIFLNSRTPKNRFSITIQLRASNRDGSAIQEHAFPPFRLRLLSQLLLPTRWILQDSGLPHSDMAAQERRNGERRIDFQELPRGASDPHGLIRRRSSPPKAAEFEIMRPTRSVEFFESFYKKLPITLVTLNIVLSR